MGRLAVHGNFHPPAKSPGEDQYSQFGPVIIPPSYLWMGIDKTESQDMTAATLDKM